MNKHLKRYDDYSFHRKTVSKEQHKCLFWNDLSQNIDTTGFTIK